MPSLEKPCLLLPHGSERSTVYLCVPVDPSLATKSSVIDTLIEFDGFVELPEGVSLDEFEAWAAIVNRDPFTLSLDELSFALQVGGRLSAQNTTQVAAAVAAKLMSTSWSSSAQKQSVLRALLPLSKDMQQLVFRQLAQCHDLPAPTLFSWPVPLQQAYADRWAAPGHGSQARSFCIHQNQESASVLSYLSLLSRTDPSLPGLTSLDLECPIPTPEAASLLSSALLHHTALEELDIPYLLWEPCGPSPPAAAVFRTLPQLTAITSLTLSAPCLPPSPPTPSTSEAAREAIQAMAAAISALPSLKDFCLCSMPSIPKQPPTVAQHATSPTPKRRRIAACMGPRGSAAALPSFRPVFAALSTAPALDDLTLFISAAMFHQLHTLLCETTCGRFRCLQGLTCDVSGEAGADDSSDAGAAGRLAACAAMLAAPPLAALTCMEYVDSSSAAAADSAAMRAVYSAAAGHPALEEAEVQLGPNARPNRGREARPRYVNGDTWGVYVTAGMGTAPRDFKVEFCIAPPVTDSITASLSASLLSASLADLDFLHIKVRDWSDMKVMEGVDRVAPMLQCLAALTHLKSIGFAIEGCSAETANLCDSFLKVPLQSFRLLTHLSFELESCKYCEILVQRLHAMPQLQRLTVGEFESGTSSSALDFEACFAPLTALTYLRVDTKPITADLVRAFARVVAGMPELQYANLVSCADDHSAAVDWFQGLLDLPCRGAYEFWCRNQLSPEIEGREVLQQLIKKGASLRESYGTLLTAESAMLGQMLQVDFSCESRAEKQ